MSGPIFTAPDEKSASETASTAVAREGRGARAASRLRAAAGALLQPAGLVLAAFRLWPKQAQLGFLIAFGSGVASVMLIRVAQDRIAGVLAKRSNVSVSNALGVVVSSAQKKTLQRRFETFATLLPSTEVTLRLQVGAKIQEILAPVGKVVKQGDPILRLSSEVSELKAKLTETEGRIRDIDFKVYQMLAKRKFVSQKEFLEKEADRQNFQIRQKLSELESPNLVLAPVDGTVTEMTFRVGDFIDNPQNYYVKIANTDSYRVELYVPYQIRQALTERSEIKLFRQDETAAGVIRSIAPVIDPKTGSVFIDVAVSEPPKGWLAGLHVSVRLVFDQREDAVTVSSEALLREEQKTYVYKVVDSDQAVGRKIASESDEGGQVAKKVEVKVGMTDGDYVQIEEGLEEFDQVVVRGQSALSDGAPVTVEKIRDSD